MNKALITTVTAKSVIMGIIVSLVGSIVTIIIIFTEASHFLLLGPASCHDPLIGLLMLLFSWVKRINGPLDIFLDSCVATVFISLVSPVVCVPACIEGCGNLIVSKEHVLSVIVDEIALLVAQVKLSNKAGNSKLLNDLEDVKLLIETRSRLCLELVLGIV